MFGLKPFFTIETNEQLQDIAPHLQSQDIIAVDLEANSLYAFRERISLIQVSTYDNDYIIDPISVSDLRPLLEVLKNADIRKVMHGSDFDIVSFKRDYDTEIVNLFDTLIAARFLRYSQLGLAALIYKHFGYPLDKRYQKHNWAKRPLLQEHLDYARGDTHWLLALYELLSRHLKKIDMFEATLEESILLTKKKWNGKGSNPYPFTRLKGFRTLSMAEKKRVRAIWELREQIAERFDYPSFRIFPNQKIISLALGTPESKDFQRILGSSLLGAENKNLHRVLDESKNDERTFVENQRVAPPLPSSPYMERILSSLRLWRNGKVEKEKIDPIIVFSNGQLKDIARAAPQSKEEFDSIEGIRTWQKKLYTAVVLQIVYDALPQKARK